MRNAWIIASGVAFATGATIAAAASTDRPRVYGYGLTLVIVATLAAATWAVCRQLERQTRDTEAAFEMGHAAGYREGRRVARPVVVPMLGRYEGQEDDDAHQTTAVGQVASHRQVARRDAPDLYGASQG